MKLKLPERRAVSGPGRQDGGAPAAAPHDVLIWAAPHPRRIFCDPALHKRFEPAAVKTVRTNCVCSGAHCAAVGGFAALRMRRPLYGE